MELHKANEKRTGCVIALMSSKHNDGTFRPKKKCLMNTRWKLVILKRKQAFRFLCVSTYTLNGCKQCNRYRILEG